MLKRDFLLSLHVVKLGVGADELGRVGNGEKEKLILKGQIYPSCGQIFL